MVQVREPEYRYCIKGQHRKNVVLFKGDNLICERCMSELEVKDEDSKKGESDGS